LAVLYAGACLQLMTGLIGMLTLCILGRPLIVGADGFRFVYNHFVSLGMVTGQLFIVSYLFWELVGAIVVYNGKIVFGYKQRLYQQVPKTNKRHNSVCG
jgi:hypothetical protein